MLYSLLNIFGFRIGRDLWKRPAYWRVDNEHVSLLTFEDVLSNYSSYCSQVLRKELRVPLSVPVLAVANIFGGVKINGVGVSSKFKRRLETERIACSKAETKLRNSCQGEEASQLLRQYRETAIEQIIYSALSDLPDEARSMPLSMFPAFDIRQFD